MFNISENDTVLVKEIKRGIDQHDIEKLAASIVDTLNGEHYIKAVVGIGTPIANVKDLAQSFKEAQIAMEVGKVFDTEQAIVSYDHLGIARLIYQLPTTLCEMFLKEVFKQGSIESLDAETLFTIQRFFRKQPQRFGDEPRPVRAPQHTGVPSGKNQKADGPGPAGIRRRHCVQGGADGQEIPERQPREVLRKKSRCGKACFRRSGAFLEYAVPAVQYRGRQARIPCAGRCFARTHSTVTPIGE